MTQQEQLQDTIQITAHQKELTFNVFHYTIEALEEYIEKIGYSGFKKQIFDKSINSPDRSPADLADDFLTQLHCFKAITKNKPEFFLNEIRQEYYKWISSSRINADKCPKILKHYLFELNEILEGRGEQIVEQTKELLNDGKKNDPKDVIKVFGVLQEHLNKNRERGELLKGKNYHEIEVESKFSGGDSVEQGEQIFNQIANSIPNHDDFNFFPQREQVDEFWLSHQEIIGNVKQNIGQWEIKEIITSIGCCWDKNAKKWVECEEEEKKELMLVNNSVPIGYNEFGHLEPYPGKIYHESAFTSEEWMEIKQVLETTRKRKDSDSLDDASERPKPKKTRNGNDGSESTSENTAQQLDNKVKQEIKQEQEANKNKFRQEINKAKTGTDDDKVSVIKNLIKVRGEHGYEEQQVQAEEFKKYLSVNNIPKHKEAIISEINENLKENELTIEELDNEIKNDIKSIKDSNVLVRDDVSIRVNESISKMGAKKRFEKLENWFRRAKELSKERLERIKTELLRFINCCNVYHEPYKSRAQSLLMQIEENQTSSSQGVSLWSYIIPGGLVAVVGGLGVVVAWLRRKWRQGKTSVE